MWEDIIMYVLTYLHVASTSLYPDYELLHPLILCLCDYSPSPLVSTLMTYRAPLARLLTTAAVTYVYWGGAGVIHLITGYLCSVITPIPPSPTFFFESPPSTKDFVF